MPSTPYSWYLRGTRISLPFTPPALCFFTTILSRNRLWCLPVFQGLRGVRENRCAEQDSDQQHLSRESLLQTLSKTQSSRKKTKLPQINLLSLHQSFLSIGLVARHPSGKMETPALGSSGGKGQRPRGAPGHPQGFRHVAAGGSDGAI